MYQLYLWIQYIGIILLLVEIGIILYQNASFNQSLVLNYCRIKYPKPLGLILFFFHAGITVSVLTCEYHTLFYTSIAYTKEGVYPHLILGHGIIYNHNP